MRALKVLVAVMSLAIVAGLVVVIVTIVTRTGGSGAGGGDEGFGAARVALPEGCVVAEAIPAERRLLLRLEGPRDRGCAQILVIDLESGATLGHLSLEPGAAAPAVPE